MVMMEAEKTVQDKTKYWLGAIAGAAVGLALWMFTVRMLVAVK